MLTRPAIRLVVTALALAEVDEADDRVARLRSQLVPVLRVGERLETAAQIAGDELAEALDLAAVPSETGVEPAEHEVG